MCDPPKALWKISLVAKGEATCKNPWILINYAVFTGGNYFSISPGSLILNWNSPLSLR
jgi:hypothetical protein